jgi:hypothetical protein
MSNVKFWFIPCSDIEEPTPAESPLVWLNALYIPTEYLKDWGISGKLSQASDLFSDQ